MRLTFALFLLSLDLVQIDCEKDDVVLNSHSGEKCLIDKEETSSDQSCSDIEKKLPGAEYETENFEEAVPNFDKEELLNSILTDDAENTAWPKTRIAKMWPHWQEGYPDLAGKYNMTGRRKRKILAHIGALARVTGIRWAQKIAQGTGMYLGEHVQWSDLIASLHILGHELHVSTQTETLERLLFTNQTSRTPRSWDLIYSDIIGMEHIEALLKEQLSSISCKLRILAIYGADPQFNSKEYLDSHPYKSVWGGHNIKPLQYYTMYPFAPDNTFLGFAIAAPDLSGINHERRNKRGLVYGKTLHMWEGKRKYLDVVSEYLELHATVGAPVGYSYNTEIPSYVLNHGVVDVKSIETFYKVTKVLIGLGTNYEGPAPLEAISYGCIFINPKFDPPRNRENSDYFEGKPTMRNVTSQNTYAEKNIGKPYVYTIDVNNVTELRAAIREAIKSKVPPYLPYEFQAEGMLQRVNVLIEKQDFCKNKAGTWPPRDAMKVVISTPGQSCRDACNNENLICEPSFFPLLNSLENFAKLGIKCNDATMDMELIHPSVTQGQCELQGRSLLFSCVGEEPDVTRICPCRDFMKTQTAFCTQCL